jgi:hypothetical protein
MKFTVGHFYLDRAGNEWQCIKSSYGSLPTFIGMNQKIIVQNINGRYRWDDIEHERDIIEEMS